MIADEVECVALAIRRSIFSGTNKEVEAEALPVMPADRKNAYAALLAYHRNRVVDPEEVEAVAKAMCNTEYECACPHPEYGFGEPDGPCALMLKNARAALAASDAYRIAELERMTRG